jgi:hypothetical protein
VRSGRRIGASVAFGMGLFFVMVPSFGLCDPFLPVERASRTRGSRTLA